jgi:hypothetical protein
VDRNALRSLLGGERVREDAYALDGTVPDDAMCLQPAAGGWTVLYSERGQRTGERWFETEDEACDFLAERLLADGGNRLPWTERSPSGLCRRTRGPAELGAFRFAGSSCYSDHVAMWVRLSEWMMVDGEPPLPEVGTVYPNVGVRIGGSWGDAVETDVDGIHEIGDRRRRDGWPEYRAIGTASWPRDLYRGTRPAHGLPTPADREHVGVEFAIRAGQVDLVAFVNHGRASQVRDDARVSVQGCLSVIGTFEWDDVPLPPVGTDWYAFPLPPVRTDWLVRKVRRIADGAALLDLEPVRA